MSPRIPARLAAVAAALLAAMAAVEKAGFTRLLDGGIVYDFVRPVRAGDKLIVYMKVKDIMERVGEEIRKGDKG